MPQFTREPGTGPTDHCNGWPTDYRERCRHDGDCITAYGCALLEAFRHANPGVLFTKDNNPCFGVIATGSIRRHYPCDGFSFGVGSILIDHEGAARVEKDAAVYIPQPYYTAAYNGFDGDNAVQELADRIGRAECLRKRLSGSTLEIQYAGAGRSWYYPGNSALWVIGKPEAVATIKADYPVPQPPEVLTMGQRGGIKTTPEQFDAPTPCPRWTVELPDWTCTFVTNRGNVCGKTTGPERHHCQRHYAR